MPAQHNAFISGAGRNIGRAVCVEVQRGWGCNIVINQVEQPGKIAMRWRRRSRRSEARRGC